MDKKKKLQARKKLAGMSKVTPLRMRRRSHSFSSCMILGYPFG